MPTHSFLILFFDQVTQLAGQDLTWATTVRALNPSQWSVRDFLIYYFNSLSLLYTFSVNGIKGLSMLLIFSKNQLLWLWILFFSSELFISVLISRVAFCLIDFSFPCVCVCVCVYVCVCTHSVAQPCLTLWDPMDCSPPGSTVHGIFQARILEGVAISYSRGSSWPVILACPARPSFLYFS